MNKSDEMRGMISLLGQWLNSRQTHQELNDPAFNESYKNDEVLASEIRLRGQMLTATEAGRLMGDLEQMMQFIKDGESQRDKRDKLLSAGLDDAVPEDER